MSLPPDQLEAILDLESRHDQLLEMLADLEKRVASALAEWQSARLGMGNGPPIPAEDSRPAKTAA